MKQGEVWLINLDPTIGAEIQKTRPAVIVNNNSFGLLPLSIIVPITDWKHNFSFAPWMIKIEPSNKNGLSKISALDCFQVRSVSQQRFIKKLGNLTLSQIEEIRISLSLVFSS